MIRSVSVVRLFCLFFLASVALGTPPPTAALAVAPIDERYADAQTLAERQAILLEALEALLKVGHRDPVLVWRTGILLGGLFGHGPDGGLLTFERIGEAPMEGRALWGDQGPHVVEVRWNSESSRAEWIENIREYGNVPDAQSSTGQYLVRTHPDFRALLTQEIEQRMRALLLAGEIQGSELERHLIRVIWSSVRPRPPALDRFVRRMIPLSCGEALRRGLKP